MSQHSGSGRVCGKRWPRLAALLALAPIAALIWAGGGAAAPSGTADLRVTKVDGPDPVAVGTPLTYTIQVENLGPSSATGVVLTDPLPKNVDFVSATASSGQCALKGKKVTCELGDAGAPSVNYGSLSVVLTVIPRKVGTIRNTASVKADQKDPVGANSKATATTTVVGPPVTCRGVVATAVGSERGDVIVATNGPDVIASLGGKDTIVSLAGRDLVCAGKGDDYVGAGSAADRVFGGAGDDRLLGRGAGDLLKGSSGDDILKGNRGPDRLHGGSDFDRCRGGQGGDRIRGCEQATR